MVYVDYETGEIVDNELEFNKEIDDMVINYMNNKLTIKVDKINIIPPIVGVPCFFKCDFGPSSLSDCPTFSFLKIGITIIEITTLVTKDNSNIFT